MSVGSSILCIANRLCVRGTYFPLLASLFLVSLVFECGDVGADVGGNESRGVLAGLIGGDYLGLVGVRDVLSCLMLSHVNPFLALEMEPGRH